MAKPSTATQRLKAACALLEAGDARGTGFLVAPEYILTCHHVVRDVGDARVVARFPHGQQEAYIELLDAMNDCALLRLTRPVAPSEALPLPLATASAAKGSAWDGYGFPAVTGQAGLLIDGQIQDPCGLDPELRLALVLRSANITAGAWLNGYSGSPVVVDGTVVGQMRQIIPDATGGAQLAVLYACPASILAGLLRQRVELATVAPSALLRGQAAPTSPQPVFCVPRPLHPHFTGRQHTLQALRQALLEKPLVALWGLGGMGKTQTALAFAHRYADENPTAAVLWIGGESASEFVLGLFALGKPLWRAGRLSPPYDDRDPATVRQAVVDYLEQAEDYLLICDNVDAPQSLKDVWPRRFGGRVLLTSRSHDVYRLGAVVIELGKLPLEEARAYLGACHPPRSPAEQQALAELVQEFDGLPLALAQAAAFLTEHQSRYGDYLRQYRKQRLGLLEQGLPADYPRSVATTWAMSVAEVERMAPPSVELLKLCAMLHPDSIPEELLVQSLPKDDDELAIDRRLKPLLNHGLVQRDRETRLLAMHRLVHQALQQRMDSSEQQRLARAVAAYLDASFPFVQYENWPLCRRLLPQVAQLSEHVDRFALMDMAAARPLEQAGYFLAEQGQYTAAEPLLRRALLIREKALGMEHPDYATGCNSLGRFLREQGRLDEAEPLCQKALDIWEHTLGPEHPKVAFALNNLGKLLHARGQLAAGEPLLRRALYIREKAYSADDVSITYSLHNLGWLLYEQGNLAAAEPLLRRAVAVREKVLDPGNPELALALRSLGVLLSADGKQQEAELLLQRALLIQEQALPASHPQLQATHRALKALRAKEA